MLDIDTLHKLDAQEILDERITIAQIIRKHIYDCYINSFITEAGDLAKDYLLASFLLRFQYLQEHGADMELENAAREYLQNIPVPDTPLKGVQFDDGYLKPRRPIDPIDFLVYRHFLKYISQIKFITTTETTDTVMLKKWRSGIHGESGLGYQLTSLLRTESDTAQATASADTYIKAGIPAYKFNAMLDDKTCKKCRALNGHVFFMRDKQPGVNFPPIHKNCRCYIEPVWLQGNNISVDYNIRRYKK